MEKPNMVSHISEALKLTAANFFPLILVVVIMQIISTSLIFFVDPVANPILYSLTPFILMIINIPLELGVLLVTIDRIYGIKKSPQYYIGEALSLVMPAVLTSIKISVLVIIFSLIITIVVSLLAFAELGWVMVILGLLLIVPMIMFGMVVSFAYVDVSANKKTAKLEELYTLVKPHMGSIFVAQLLLGIIIFVIVIMFMGISFAIGSTPQFSLDFLTRASTSANSSGMLWGLIYVIVNAALVLYHQFFITSIYVDMYEYDKRRPVINGAHAINSLYVKQPEDSAEYYYQNNVQPDESNTYDDRYRYDDRYQHQAPLDTPSDEPSDHETFINEEPDDQDQYKD